MKGFIYKFCIETNCYYGFTKSPTQREKQHREKIVTLWNNEMRNEGDFLSFLRGSKNLKFDLRYYKMFSFLICEKMKPDRFIFEIKRESNQLSGGGLLEKNYAKRGLFNGQDKSIGLNKKVSFWEEYKNSEEIYTFFIRWKEEQNE